MVQIQKKVQDLHSLDPITKVQEFFDLQIAKRYRIQFRSQIKIDREQEFLATLEPSDFKPRPPSSPVPPHTHYYGDIIIRTFSEQNPFVEFTTGIDYDRNQKIWFASKKTTPITLSSPPTSLRPWLHPHTAWTTDPEPAVVRALFQNQENNLIESENQIITYENLSDLPSDP